MEVASRLARVRWAIVAITAASTAQAQPADWTVHRDPFDAGVVARYKQLLARDPYDGDALIRLAQMYRRYRTLAGLEAEYETAGDDHAVLVVRARLHRDRGDASGARALFQKVVSITPDDARGWLALGDLERTHATMAAARADYEHVVALAPPRAVLEPALHALADLSRDAGDGDGTDRYYDQLCALAPQDGLLWLSRGDAEVATGHPERAVDSFAAAQQAFTTDPERRLEAIVRRGDALDRAQDQRGAIAEYRRGLRLAPQGGARAHELVARIVEAYREARALPELAEQLEHDWPASRRDYFEWQTLGALYSDLEDPARAIGALTHAFRAAPWETDNALHLIALLDRVDRSAEALAIHTAASLAAPGDAPLALALADRLWPHDTPAALAVLHRLETRFASDSTQLDAIATAYAKHQRHDQAQRVRVRIVRLEPDVDDHWIALASSYMIADDVAGAVAQWRRVAKQRTPAWVRFADMLLDHEAYADAALVLSEAIAFDGRDPSAWRARAWALEGMGDARGAIDHAERALQLTPADRLHQHVARHLVIQMLQRAIRADRADETLWNDYVERWHRQFVGGPDLQAGYLVVDAYEANACVTFGLETDPPGCCPDGTCDVFFSTVDELARLVPDDPEVLIAQARSYELRHDYAGAIARLEDISRRFPERARSIAVEINEVRARDPRLEGIRDPFPTSQHPGDSIDHARDAVGAKVRFGAQAGAEMQVTGPANVGLIVAARGIFALTDRVGLVGRIEWDERGDTATAPNAAGASLGIHRRVATTDATALAVGVNQRVELRVGDRPDRTWDRVGMASEVETDLVLRAAPLAVGGRLEYWEAGGVIETRLVLALTIEMR